MGAKEFGIKVLREIGLEGWKIKFSNAGAICLFDSKTILIERAPSNHPGQVLHEIAHAWAITEAGDDATGSKGHGFEWWKRFERLVSQFTEPKGG